MSTITLVRSVDMTYHWIDPGRKAGKARPQQEEGERRSSATVTSHSPLQLQLTLAATL
jgi:hypothetical protein